MTAPLDVPGAATEAAPEAALTGSGVAIAGRSLGQIAWMRLKRDRVAMGGGVLVILLILIALTAPWIVSALGHPPNEFHQDAIDPNLQTPIGAFGGASSDYPFGLE
ncbi:MAG TPA: hypothetical protein VHN80_19815, partial [Kineosporiaceae bacterium]|nr:hypothetical protein [Kineosporiaceae bacterium]